jgi:hypothetical protein
MSEDQNLPAVPTEDLGLGFEDMEGQDFSAPFISICQQMSPYTIPTHPLYIEEARLGMIINTQTSKCYDKITIIVCKYAFRNVEWKPRTSGGGFVGSYTRDTTPDDLKVVDPIKGTVGRPNGNIIVPTAYYLCLLAEEGFDRVIIPMYSTQLKKSRSMNALFLSIKDQPTGKPLPLFSTMWELSTIVEHKDQWTYYGWSRPQPAGSVLSLNPAVYEQAKETHAIGNFLPEKLLEAAAMATTSEPDQTDVL